MPILILFQLGKRMLAFYISITYLVISVRLIMRIAIKICPNTMARHSERSEESSVYGSFLEVLK